MTGHGTHALGSQSLDKFPRGRRKIDLSELHHKHHHGDTYGVELDPSGSPVWVRGDDFYVLAVQPDRLQIQRNLLQSLEGVVDGGLLTAASRVRREERTERKGVWLDPYGQHDLLHHLLGKYETLEGSRQDEKEGRTRKLFLAESQEDVLAILGEAGLSEEVEQLRRYLADREEESEEGEYPGIRLESLKAVSHFLMSNDDLPFSAIKADFDGFADLEWFLSSRREEGVNDDKFWGEGDGQFVLRFVTPNLIEFAMLSGPWIGEAERLSLSGTMSHSKMRAILDLFIRRMVPYGEG